MVGSWSFSLSWSLWWPLLTQSVGGEGVPDPGGDQMFYQFFRMRQGEQNLFLMFSLATAAKPVTRARRRL
jgi:hypothetical protein